MKEQKTTAGEGLGTAGLTIGILAIITALIPCFGWLALLLGTIALILSSVAVSQAYKRNGNKGLTISALFISITVIIIKLLQLNSFITFLSS